MKIENNKYWKSSKWLLCFLLFPSLLWGQKSSSYIKAPNKIIDPTHSLDPFYNKLYTLTQNTWRFPFKNNDNPSVVSVAHIGDSHIQAGFFTTTIMNLLQEKFGNAGRGLIFPLKLARTNEPNDYLIRSESKWDKTLCIQQVQKMPIGLGGMAIKTNDEHFTFEIRLSSDSKSEANSFNKITVFHHEKAPELVVADQGIKAQNEKAKYPFASTILLDKKVSSLMLSTIPSAKMDSAIYYGFSLENGNKGVLYHAVGINGAQFRHYASVQDFAKQISLLDPALFIFSLGTNEAFRGKLVERRFFEEIDRIIEPIRAANPRALVLITTPPDCLESMTGENRKSNPNIGLVRNALINYAQKKGYAYWDLYSILGGENSANTLLQSGALSKDGVHFKKNGYTMLGELFFDALISNYTEYVQHRF